MMQVRLYIGFAEKQESILDLNVLYVIVIAIKTL
jgi:hypothetical protein